MNTRLFDTIKTMSRSEMKANLAFEFNQIVEKVDFELIKEKTINAFHYVEAVVIDVNNKTLTLIIFTAFYIQLFWNMIVTKANKTYSRIRNLDILEQKEEEKMQMLELVKDTYELENGFYKDLDKSARRKMLKMRKEIKRLQTSLSLQKAITESTTKHLNKKLNVVKKENYEIKSHIEQSKEELYHLRRENHYLNNQVYIKENQIRQMNTERYNQQNYNNRNNNRNRNYNNRNNNRNNNRRNYKPSYNKKRENEQRERPNSYNQKRENEQQQEYRNVRQEQNMPY